jgi:hypothetical protein
MMNLKSILLVQHYKSLVKKTNRDDPNLEIL